MDYEEFGKHLQETMSTTGYDLEETIQTVMTYLGRQGLLEDCAKYVRAVAKAEQEGGGSETTPNHSE